MIVAYVLASVLLIGTIAFSYFNLKSILVDESRLNALEATTGELRLAIRESAIHVSELKAPNTSQPSESRLEHKIREQLRTVLTRIDTLVAKTQTQVDVLSNSDYHSEFVSIFNSPPSNLWRQLEEYSIRLKELTKNESTGAHDSSDMWLAVEATSAEKGMLSLSYQTALVRIQELVIEKSNLLANRHKNLSLLSIVILLLEALLIFIPLSRMFKRAHRKMQQAHDELFQQANFDVVTGLPNTTGIISQLSVDDAPEITKGLLVVRLQNIDDIYNIIGPDSIAEFFKTFSLVLARVFPDNSLFFRSGDTEFGVILVDGADFSELAPFTQWKAQLTQKLYVGNSLVFPQISLGLDQDHVRPNGLSSMLVNARLAQQHYKHTESVPPVYQLSMRTDIVDENRMVEKIREGLQNGEFVPFYQIKVDANSGQPCAMEALCRWIQPDGTMVSPGQFIPVAENSGLITQLTWQLLEQIAKDWKQWNAIGLDPGRVAFNAAELFLLEPALIERLEQIVQSTGANYCPIDLEVTENITLTQEQSPIAGILRAVRDLGMKVALDDFGTGYASLSSITTFEVDSIKVDQSFVRSMTTDEVSRNVVVAIINLCKMLDLHCVVEGVEIEEQWHICQEAGCDEIQGFFFYKPAPFEQVSEHLSKAQPMRLAG